MVAFPRWMVIGSLVGSTVGGACLFRNFVTKGCRDKVDPEIRLDGKVFIVTGCNTGIGKETVRDLAQRSAVVYLACRDLKKCQEARDEIVLETKNRKLYCRECDLTDLRSIDKFVTRFKKEESRLDVLINNAGVMRVSPRQLTKQGFELQLGVNHMAHFYLTHLLLDYLKLSAPSRIVNVSSIAHIRGKINFDDLNSEKSYDPSDAYSNSKLAQILFTLELSKRLENTGVTVNSLHPGIVKTEITRYMSFEKSYFASVFVKPLMSLFMKTPKVGAETSIFAAIDPSVENVSGKYFDQCLEKTPSLNADELTVKKLFATSEKWCGIKYD